MQHDPLVDRLIRSTLETLAALHETPIDWDRVLRHCETVATAATVARDIARTLEGRK